MQKKEYLKMYHLEEEHFWFRGKRAYIDSVLKNQIGVGKILDVGCGTGGLTKYLEKYGEVVGVDSSKTAIKLTKSRGVKVVEGEVELLPFSDNEFDLVCIFDVLYHERVGFVDRALRELYRVVKPGGYLLITDSAFEFLRGYHDGSLGGKRRFTREDLSRRLKNAEFNVVKSTYIFGFLLVPVFVTRLVGMFLGKVKSDVGEVNYWVNMILYTMALLEAKLVLYINLPWGTSVCLYARKGNGDK